MECRTALKNARYKKFINTDDNRLKLYLIEVGVVKEHFLNRFEKTKFRSEFKKSFFASMQSTERISKKQLNIMYNMLSYDDNYSYINETVLKKKKEFIINELKNTNVTREEIEFVRKEIRKKKMIEFITSLGIFGIILFIIAFIFSLIILGIIFHIISAIFIMFLWVIKPVLKVALFIIAILLVLSMIF